MHHYRKSSVFILWVCLVMSVCGCSSSSVIGTTPYRAELLIGQSQQKVLSMAEPVFGKAKQEGKVFENQPKEVDVRRYAFTNLSDFVMYFHKGRFIQAGLMPAASPLYPALRRDYQQITPEEPGPVLGYVLIKEKDKVIVDTLPIRK